MSDAVRVRLKDGRETNLSPYFAKKLGATVLKDEPTINPDGSTRRDTAKDGRTLKTRVTVDEASAAKKAVTSASNKKEQDK